MIFVEPSGHTHCKNSVIDWSPLKIISGKTSVCFPSFSKLHYPISDVPWQLFCFIYTKRSSPVRGTEFQCLVNVQVHDLGAAYQPIRDSALAGYTLDRSVEIERATTAPVVWPDPGQRCSLAPALWALWQADELSRVHPAFTQQWPGQSPATQCRESRRAEKEDQARVWLPDPGQRRSLCCRARP